MCFREPILIEFSGGKTRTGGSVDRLCAVQKFPAQEFLANPASGKEAGSAAQSGSTPQPEDRSNIRNWSELLQESAANNLIIQFQLSKLPVFRASPERLFNPDVVVLDIAMPHFEPFGAAVRIRKINAHTKILFLTIHGTEDYISGAFYARASG
jgi:CheY-like chemotaxis protein